jgi:flagellar motor switch protein FliG
MQNLQQNNEKNSSDKVGSGVFLNGKSQIIEMLKYMNSNEKSALLNNIKVRNPQLAAELIERSLSFNDLNKLQDHDLGLIFNYTAPQILGIALKDVSKSFQKRILSLAPRNYAEEAYGILVRPISNEKKNIQQAQRKIVDTLISLNKRKQLSL